MDEYSFLNLSIVFHYNKRHDEQFFNMLTLMGQNKKTTGKKIAAPTRMLLYLLMFQPEIRHISSLIEFQAPLVHVLLFLFQIGYKSWISCFYPFKILR